MFYWFISQSINQQISLPSDCMNRNHIKTNKICICTAIPMKFAKAQYTPPTPTRLNSTVASRRRRRCVLGIIDLSICLCYHTATTLSQRSVPRESESTAVPSKFHNLGGQQKNDPVPLKLRTKSPPLPESDYRRPIRVCCVILNSNE